MFWGFLQSNIVPLLTVISGFVVVLGNQFGFIPDTMLPATTLSLITLLATSEIIDRSVMLNKMHNEVRQLEKLVRQGWGNTNTEKLLPDACYNRIKEEIEDASVSIMWMSPQSRKGTGADVRRVYEAAIDTIVRKGTVRLTWITRLDNQARISRKQRITSIAKDPAKISIKEIPPEYSGDLALSFIIFDRKVVVTRAPFHEGLEGMYIISKDPIMVEMFVDYFNYIARKTIT